MTKNADGVCQDDSTSLRGFFSFANLTSAVCSQNLISMFV